MNAQLTIAEAAALAGVPGDALRNAIDLRQLIATKVAGILYVQEPAVIAWRDKCVPAESVRDDLQQDAADLDGMADALRAAIVTGHAGAAPPPFNTTPPANKRRRGGTEI